MNETEINATLDELVQLGDMIVVGASPQGEPLYRLTEQGKRKVEAMLAAPSESTDG